MVWDGEIIVLFLFCYRDSIKIMNSNLSSFFFFFFLLSLKNVFQNVGFHSL
ncbi:unnamed protein product [Linum tenue]|uniref:NADH dehydrogenase subunit 4L n=1 Tax=Linum tenue TaxID=586396 RepID=A0AAV0KBQ4_9ROSI|nr:unnamed protein product [Linum tenue]